MKSAKVMKKKRAKVRKPTVPKDVLAVITEGFSGHEKLYDAVGRLWGRTSKRIFELPNLGRLCDYRMMIAMRDKMHNIFSENVSNANTRYLQSKGVRAAFAIKPK
jgi:hypothetical protein